MNKNKAFYLAHSHKLESKRGEGNSSRHSRTRRVEVPCFLAQKLMKEKLYAFEAIIQKVPDQDGAYVVFPYDIRKEFGKGRVKVHATFDGEPYNGSIVNMGLTNPDGSVCYIIGIRKDIRNKINKQPGDVISITIKERA